MRKCIKEHISEKVIELIKYPLFLANLDGSKRGKKDVDVIGLENGNRNERKLQWFHKMLSL